MITKQLPGPKGVSPPEGPHSPLYATVRPLLSLHALDVNAHSFEWVCPSVPQTGE